MAVPLPSLRAKARLDCLIRMFLIVGAAVTIAPFLWHRHAVAHKNPVETLLNDPKPLVKMIIITSGRSGSTMLGDAMRAHPDVIYIYEPCRIMKLVDDACYQLHLLLLNCNVTAAVWNELQHDDRLVAHSSHTLPFRRMTHSAARYNLLCRQKHRIVKDIRIHALEEDPSGDGVTFLYLYRHPLAVAHSWLTKHMTPAKTPDFNASATYICTTMARLEALRERVRPVVARYEAIAQNPEDELGHLVAELKLDPHPTLRTWIAQHMNSSQPMSEVHRQAAKQAEQWKKDVTVQMASHVEHDCRNITERLGYQYPK